MEYWQLDSRGEFHSDMDTRRREVTYTIGIGTPSTCMGNEDGEVLADPVWP